MPHSTAYAAKQRFDTRMRHRIQRRSGAMIDRLIEHVKGAREMSSTQVRAALGLLAKALPDLQSVELQAGDGGPIIIITGIDRSPALLQKTEQGQVIDATATTINDDDKSLIS